MLKPIKIVHKQNAQYIPTVSFAEENTQPFSM